MCNSHDNPGPRRAGKRNTMIKNFEDIQKLGKDTWTRR